MDKTLRPQLEAFIVETDNCIDICKSKYSNIDGALKLSRKFISEKKFLLSVSTSFYSIFSFKNC